MSNKSYYVVGAYFAKALDPYLAKEFSTKGQTLLYPKEQESVARYLQRMTEQIREQMPKDGVDYLVVELQSLLEKLQEPFSEKAEAEAIAALDELWKCIKSSFCGEKIFVIGTNSSGYFIVAEKLIKVVSKRPNLKSALKRLNLYEKQLVKKTDGILVNTTESYFYRKLRGRSFRYRYYEKECYLDIAKKLARYAKTGKPIGRATNPGCRIDRYCKYGGITMEWKALGEILSREKIVERMILSSPVSFVEQYRSEFLQAMRLPQGTFEEYRDCVRDFFGPNSVFAKILIAFYATNSGRFEEEISYLEMFREGIVSIEVLKQMRGALIQKRVENPQLLTAQNAGFYYGLLQGKDETEAMTFVKEGVYIRPVTMDVFGTCISRTCLREEYSGNDSLVSNRYWFHVPAYADSQGILSYEEEVFDGLIGVNAHNVRIQFEQVVLDEIATNPAEWLLIDLYGLDSPCAYEYDGFVYTDFEGKVSKRLNATPVEIIRDASLLGDWDTILERMNPWIATVKETYGNRIIMMETCISPYNLGDDNKVYLPRNYKKIKQNVEFQKKAFAYVAEKLNCYTIELMHDFCADECGYAKRSKAHASYDFYRETYKLIHHIVYNEPEQKHFCDHDFQVRLQRMTKMLSANKPEQIREFFSGSLDEVVLNLPLEMIRDNMDLIQMWYGSYYRDAKELLNGWSEEWNAEVKNYLIQHPVQPIYQDNSKLLKDYEK